MENSENKIYTKHLNQINPTISYSSLKPLVLHLKRLNYPEELFSFNFEVTFFFKDKTHTLNFPLVIKDQVNIYLLVDLKPQENLTCFERAFIALARLYIKPFPHLGVVTNLLRFVLIDFYTAKVSKGGMEIIPKYETFVSRTKLKPKDFNPEIERKILTFYLEGG